MVQGSYFKCSFTQLTLYSCYKTNIFKLSLFLSKISSDLKKNNGVILPWKNPSQFLLPPSCFPAYEVFLFLQAVLWKCITFTSPLLFFAYMNIKNVSCAHHLLHLPVCPHSCSLQPSTRSESNLAGGGQFSRTLESVVLVSKYPLLAQSRPIRCHTAYCGHGLYSPSKRRRNTVTII